MQIRILKTCLATTDCKVLRRYEAGEIVNVRQTIGCKLLKEGKAETIKRGTMTKIKEIGDNLSFKLKMAQIEIVRLHTKALQEVLDEIGEGKHRDLTANEYQQIIREKVGSYEA